QQDGYAKERQGDFGGEHGMRCIHYDRSCHSNPGPSCGVRSPRVPSPPCFGATSSSCTTMADKHAHHLDTTLQHTGIAPFDPRTGAAPVALPSMRTSTVRFRDLSALDAATAHKAAGERGVTYGRIGMDTHAALEQA